MYRNFYLLLCFFASLAAVASLTMVVNAGDQNDATQSDASEVSEDPLSFNADVRPVLSNHCIFCHGPDEENRQADLRLDIPGEADLDEVLARIESTDEYEIMPPPESHKELSDQQIAVLRRWIDEGGQYEAHWAFETPTPTTVPSVTQPRWNENLIDRIVLSKLEQKKLRPSAKADRRTLLRRLTFDLTGLPPTREQLNRFLADDSEDAYEKQVDRLLASQHYGEHVGRYWLDLVRFADTNGLHHDHYREMTPYRDWVIDAFNQNLPFDEFTHWQIAGDLMDDPTRDQLVASGFNRLHLIIDRGTALPEESFNRNVVDRVSAVGTAFMGLTLQCAACHDHKYDPITQRDFYSMYAFFNNIDAAPETGSRSTDDFRRGLQAPYVNLSTEQQDRELSQLNQEIDRLTKRFEKLTGRKPGKKKSAKKRPADQKNADEKNANREQRQSKKSAAANAQAEQTVSPEAAKLEQQLKTLTGQRSKLLATIPAAMVMKERDEVRPAHILIRGVYDQPGDEVTRATPGFLPEMESDNEVKTRLDLAHWLTDLKNPLTARVTVNRFWQQFFGVGLVKTSEDFGAQGEVPRYQQLLDQLAIDFVESGWDVKRLVRQIVTSQTYQQSSVADEEAFRNDPENRWLARGSRYRMDAEMVRDQILNATGVLNDQMKGKSVKPPQPDGLWKLVTMPHSFPRDFQPDSGSKTFRRSVYTFWKRGLPPPQMTIFDAPSRESCIARRERTNTPLQALMLMNEPEYFRITVNYAAQLLAEGKTADQMLEQTYETITSKSLDDQTRQELKRGLSIFEDEYRQQPELADQMKTAYLANPSPSGVDAVELSSWTMLIHTLLNLDEIRTRE